MSKRKRDRQDDDGDGDTEVEIESASSSFRQNLNKRNRVALARERGGSVVSDEDDYRVDGYDDLLEQNTDAGSVEDPAFEYSLHNNNEGHGEEDSAIDEITATQFVEKQLRELKDNKASEEGIIEEITARNFMCHSNLRITLGPLINFIIGHNGSGKSAVLTALTMCLGGKANQTNRGANLKSMIKTGQETATLAVKIKNQGENAYKPDLYGSSITVERHFSRSGTSGFKIKNDQNKVVTTKRGDLDDILDYFSLQLDNPINVLTQDMARSFLSNSSSTDKYKFFLKGTQLETLDSDYKLFEEQLDNMNEKLRLREADIDIFEQKYKEAHARKKRADRSQAIEQKIREVARMHAWLQVQEQEELRDKYQEDIGDAQEIVQEKTDAAEAIAATFEGHDQAVQGATRRVEQLQTHIGPAKEKFEVEKDKFDKNKQELLTATNEERSIRDNLKEAKNEVVRLGEEIRLENNRLSGVHGDAHARRVEELEELKQTADNAKKSLEEHKATFPDLDKNARVLTEQYQTAKGTQETATNAARNVAEKLRNLEKEDGPWWAPYHHKMRDLVAAIDRETRWRRKPVGPMGTKVHLNKPEWGSIIEKTFGGALDGFVVTCKDDQQFLSSIAKRMGMTFSIFITNPEPIVAKEPEEGVDTILRVLKIDDDLVRNTLIMNQAIEQVVLSKDPRQAVDILQKERVKASITFGANRGSGTRYFLSRAGGEGSSPVHAWEGRHRMRTNREQQIAHERRNLDDAKKEAERAEQRARSLQAELSKAQQAVHKHKKDSVALTKQMQNDEDAVEAKQGEIDSNRPEYGKLQQLEQLLESAKEDVESVKGQFQDIVQEKERLADLGKELKSALDVVQKELDKVNKDVQKAETQLQQVENARHSALLEKNAAFDNIKTAQDHVTRLETKRDDQQKQVDDYIREASKISERVRVEEGASLKVLDDRLERFKRQRAEEEQRAGGSREEIVAHFAEAEEAWKTAKEEREHLVKIAKALQYTLKQRHFRWEEFKRRISLRARLTFQYLLSERKFRGRVLLDHDDKTLDISVEPDMTKVSDAGRQAKTLSGGEKSFSTICLLLSIWEAMGSPIRCLDEFDVFMDSVNRAQSMGMMIQTARRSVGRQFILITPQSMNNVVLGDDVKIHKMSDPERGIAAHFIS